MFSLIPDNEFEAVLDVIGALGLPKPAIPEKPKAKK